MFLDEFLSSWYGTVTLITLDLVALALVICISYRWMFKRLLDILTSVVCIAVLSPLYLVICIWATIEKKQGRLQSIFCRTPFVGEKNKTVQLLTFCVADANGDMHGYGRWMQKSKCYRLAKFFDLFLAKISVIGVKPLPESDCVFLTDVEEDRHLVKPGLINPLVLNGTKDTDYEDMLDNDKKYAWRFGFFMDCKIFFVWLLKKIRGGDDEYMGKTRETTYAKALLEEKRITQADYDEAMAVNE